MRNPSNPTSCKAFIFSGSEIPLSDTLTISRGNFPINRKEFSTSVWKLPRLRLLTPTISVSLYIDIFVYVIEFFLPVDFQQDFQFQFVGFGCQCTAFFRGKGCCDKQYGVGSDDACLVELVLIDDEIFP